MRGCASLEALDDHHGAAAAGAAMLWRLRLIGVGVGRLLAEEIIADETVRERALKLLAEERQKQKDAGNPTEAD